jgi:catechol 2,3-dioxygenase-like lactoylglutathione lyase family enzyme
MALMQLTGIHHLTAISADAPANRAFYTGILGMRLVKKTVNQDDVGAYHLFYADEIATDGPGFATDEPADKLGEKLALPPFLEPRRAEIEAGLKPL